MTEPQQCTELSWDLLNRVSPFPKDTDSGDNGLSERTQLRFRNLV